MEAMLGDYDTPRGRPEFLEIMAGFFNRAFGWNIDAENIAVTTGSQVANFLLFNMLAGSDAGTSKKILFPIVPEYIGYASQGIREEMFTAWKPRIEFVGDHQFKYRINFGEIGDDIAAICLSRPTNPTANVVTDEEMQRLSAMAEERGIYLIVDNAYGQPFPNVVFKPTAPVWSDGIIHTFSLSKLGLPGARTGIVVANKEMIQRLSIMNASLVLSTGAIGQTIAGSLFASDEIAETCRNVIEPFYKERSLQTQKWIAEYFDDALDYHVHVCEGAFFLWIWFRDLPITDRELYERLKTKKVLVVPGCYFFEGLGEPWPHRHECIRITYCAKPELVKRGIEIIAAEIRLAYGEKQKAH
jgi:valine--pyruvate aminotransferase